MACLNLRNPMKPTALNRSLSAPLLNSESDTGTTSSSSESEDSPIILSARVNVGSTLTRVSKPGYKLIDTLTTHVGPISCMALCGEFILSASQGKDIIVWQQPDLRLFTKFGSGQGSVKDIVTVGNKVFTAHQDSRIRVWKVGKISSSENIFRLIDTLPTRKDCLGKCMKQSNYVQVRRHHKKLWIEHGDSISCLAVSNGLIYSGSWDKSLKVWRVGDFKCLLSVKAHDDAVNGVVVDRDGLLYSASADGKIKVWEFVQHGKKHVQMIHVGSSNQEKSEQGTHCLKAKATLEGHKDVSMNTMIVDNKDGTVFGGSSDGWLMGWRRQQKSDNNNEDEWKMVVEMKAHQMSILCLCFMGDTFLCSGSADKSICIWRRYKFGEVNDHGSFVKVGVIRGHQGPIKCLQASPNCFGFGDGYLLYSGSLDKSLKVWWVSKDIKDDQI